jgi:hypothetical protein
MKEGRFWMLTLTHDHTGAPEDAWRELPKAWNRLASYVRKYHGPFSYVRIVEPHKQGGWPHLHVIVDKYFFTDDFGKHLKKWGFGWCSAVSNISSNGAQGYVTKYLTKGITNEQAEHLRKNTKCRMVSVSRNLGKIYPRGSGWGVVFSSAYYDECEAAVENILALSRALDKIELRTTHGFNNFYFEGNYDYDEITGWVDNIEWTDGHMGASPERIRRAARQICGYFVAVNVCGTCDAPLAL